MSNRAYDVTLAAAAGATQRIDARGALVKVLTCSYGSVGIKLDSGPEIMLRPGQGLRLESGREFRDVIVRNPEAVAKTASIYIGDGRFEDSTITGVVEVVDGGRARTMANQAFIGYMNKTAGAGNVPVIQLFNPAGSGKRVLVKAIRLSSPTAGFITVGRNTASLADGPFDPESKRLGSLTSSAKLYRADPVGAGPATGIETMNVGASTLAQITLQEPIQLDAGVGLFAWHQTVATTLIAVFEFVEESLT